MKKTQELPRHIGQTLSVSCGGKKLRIKKIGRGSFFARIEGQQHSRFGNSKEIREDIEHFTDFCALPREKGGPP